MVRYSEIFVLLVMSCGCGGPNGQDMPAENKHTGLQASNDKIAGSRQDSIYIVSPEHGLVEPNVSIVCIGELLVDGTTNNGGYQVCLGTLMKNRAALHSFVGSQAREIEGALLRHEGHTSTGTAALAEGIGNGDDVTDVEAALIYAGVYDLRKGRPIEQIVGSYRELIKNVRSLYPGVALFVGLIIEDPEIENYAKAQQFNQLLIELADELSSQQSRIIIVDHRKQFVATRMIDPKTKQLNKKGAEHIAQHWDRALFEQFWDK